MLINNLTPKHWTIYDKVMHFTAENLYEQINGRAEYYIAYDVIGMTFASFDKKTDSDYSTIWFKPDIKKLPWNSPVSFDINRQWKRSDYDSK